MKNYGKDWRHMVGYEDRYIISEYGDVFSFVKKRLLIHIVNKQGYHLVPLTKNAKIKIMFVHRAVAFTFIPNVDNKPFVNHLNSKKDDNHYKNLEWCTALENIRHRINNTIVNYAFGERHGNAKITKKAAIAIFKSSGTSSQVAKKFGISAVTVRKIKCGTTWNEATGMPKTYIPRK